MGNSPSPSAQSEENRAYQPRIIYPKTGGRRVTHTDANWRDGYIVFDLSGDKALAKAGDEEAEARLRTKRYLDARAFARTM